MAVILDLAFRLDHHEHGTDRHGIARLACHFDDLAGGRGFHFDGGLVGHHVGDLLVFLDHIAEFHMPFDDFRLGNTLADVRQVEGVTSHRINPS